MSKNGVPSFSENMKWQSEDSVPWASLTGQNEHRILVIVPSDDKTQGNGDSVVVFVYDQTGENLIGLKSLRIQDILFKNE